MSRYYYRKRHGLLYYIFIYPVLFMFKATWYLMKLMLYITYYLLLAMFYVIWYLVIGVIIALFRRDKSTTYNIASNGDGEKYEAECCDMLKRHGFTNIQTTARSGDHGIDILAKRSGRKYAIQCKCYSSAVGNHAVQEAYSGCSYYGYDIPVVLTNNTFTSNARDEAEKLNVQLWENNKIPFTDKSIFKGFFKRKSQHETDTEALYDTPNSEYMQLLNNYGNAFIEVLSSKLNSTIQLSNVEVTDYGYYLTYHSSNTTAGKLYPLQIEFNNQLEDRYEFCSLTDTDFGIKVFKETTSK